MKLKPFFSILVVAALAASRLAAETTSLELVLDCSASMWNKLEDGRYRIDGAKQVLSNFVSTTPDTPDLHVGLRIYGSKVPFSKDGACEDSVLVVPMEGFNRKAILEAVKKARAIGATPLAHSIQLARNDFTRPGVRRLSIFTDGEESCGGDVKAAIDALKADGIDVDVRIIGIGLTRQATERFSRLGVPVENVHTAQKLAEALGKGAQLKAPEVVTAGVTVKLVKDGKPLTGVEPRMAGSLNGKPVALTAAGEGMFKGNAELGVYEVKAGERTFGNLTVQKGNDNEFVLDLTEAPKVTLKVTEGATLGGEVVVQFKGANGHPEEVVVVAPVGAPDLAEPAWTATEGQKEGSVKVRVYGEPGRYEARFITKVDGEAVLAGRSAPFQLNLPEVVLKVSGTVPAATMMTVEWSGPAKPGDWIGWVKAGSKEGEYDTFTRPDPEQKTVQLMAPSTPGEYEVRYSNDYDPRVLARASFKVVESEYGLEAPAEWMAGSPVSIGWRAPKSPGVYVTIVPAGAADKEYTEFFYTAHATSPMMLQPPRTEGKHEIRINLESDEKVLHRQPILLTPMKATLEAPGSGKAGATIEVKWSGPGGHGDFVTVTAPDADSRDYTSYFDARTSSGKETLKLPDEPGNYEIRYVAGEEKVVARRPIRVE